MRTSLVGRDRAVLDILHLVRDDGVALLNLTGPGGGGKTRLAIAVASALAPDYPDGVAFVALDEVREPGFVLPSIAAALNLSVSGRQDPEERLREWLAPRRLLLVLDNVEHVVEAVPAIARLLSAAPNLTVITTSRIVLRITGEHLYRVEPLNLPSAVELFVARARAADSSFVLVPETAQTVARICARLDGVPLALELAAARVRAFPPAALLARLDDTLPLLTVGARDLPDRLRTMQRAIAWSYDLLSADEQLAFQYLAVFVGGFSLDAAAATLPHHLPALDAVASLVEKSMLQPVGWEDDIHPRYRLLETVREFGLEQLERSGHDGIARHRHAEWCLHLAEDAAPHLDGKDQVAWQDLIAGELPNIRAALSWAVDHDVDLGLRLAALLQQFWVVRGHLKEAGQVLDRLLAAPTSRPEGRARALLAASWVGFAGANFETGLQFAEQALPLFRAEAAPEGIIDACIAVGFCHDHVGQGDGDQAAMAVAATYLQEALDLAVSLDDQRRVAMATYGLASVTLGRNDALSAIELFGDASAGFEACGDWRSMSWAAARIGIVAVQHQQVSRAAEAFGRALPVFQALHDWNSAAVILAHVARLAHQIGQPVTAVELVGAIDAHRRRKGSGPPPAHDTVRIDVIDQCRGLLGPAAFDLAHERGLTLPMDEAITLALSMPIQESGGGAQPGPRPQLRVKLTAREREVLRLLALGLTDRHIADQLSISPRTVGGHVTRLLDKLDVDSRTGAAVLAIRYGLDHDPGPEIRH
jgi:predicted ATPase/DNA-binding CsgD family transcriptional regulator